MAPFPGCKEFKASDKKFRGSIVDFRTLDNEGSFMCAFFSVKDRMRFSQCLVGVVCAVCENRTAFSCV